MAAWLWVANADRWHDDHGLSAYQALLTYLDTRHVSWSTSRFRTSVKLDGDAYIWLSSAGLVAVDKVEHEPHMPAKIPGTPRWDERKAPSEWKTGIRLHDVFFDRPVPIKLQVFDTQNTVYRLTDDDRARIMAKLQTRL